MTIKDFNSDDREFLKITDFENFFTVHSDPKNNNIYNLNETLYVNVGDNQVSEYTLSHSLQWPLISYKLYGTARLAWLLMKINGVEAIDVFEIVEAGETIKYIDKSYVESILNTIKG